MATTAGDHIRRKAVLCAPELREEVEWSVQDGAHVDKGQVLAAAGSIERGNLRQLVAPCRGTLRVAAAKRGGDAGGDEAREDGDERAEGDGGAVCAVAHVEYCIHPVRNGRVCLMCLEPVDEGDLDDEHKAVNVVSHGQIIRLNLEEAKKFDSENIKRQLASKKLSLVLDLDHTLLHAVRTEDVVGELTKTDDMHFFFIPGLPEQHVVKLRPGLGTFLKEASSIYDLFIYTHGTRLYAEQIAKIIDPDDDYFRNRIVARTDTPDMVHKSLKMLFPSCEDSMIMVLDDRIDVWKENEGNVFLIEPYHFFKCTAEINNASGNGVLGVEEERSSDQTDNHLGHTLAVLKSVHEAFYEGHEGGMSGTSAKDQMAGRGRDVKTILSQLKRSILRDCFIVFSGVFPLVRRQSHESHYLWRLAVELGATPSMMMDNFPITHLVIHPDRLGTQKHVQARGVPGVSIVCPEWILKCARSWSRVPEKDFLADEWKRKHATVRDELKPAADVTTPQPGTEEAVTVSMESVETSGEPKTRTGEVSKQREGQSVVGILKDGAAGGDKAKKQVKFADKLDDSEEPKKQMRFSDSVDGSGNPKRALHKLPRSNVAMRPRMAPPRALPTGTVASGGTFDFLSKIKSIHESRKDSKVGKASELKQAAAASAAKKAMHFEEPKKDVDDAFDRLIEAEERENALERKRKLESANVKDQLANRRRKAAMAFAPAAKAVITISDSDDDGDEAQLDDLEADILGDL